MKRPTTFSMKNFNAGVRALAKYADVPEARAFDFEAGKILESAVKKTPAATVSKIKDKLNNAEFLSLDLGGGRKTYSMLNRYSDAVWKKIQAARKKVLQAKLKARGLSKRAWHALAEMAGLRVVTPAYVPKATASDGSGQHPENSSVERLRGKGKYRLTLTTRQPTVQTPFVGGQRIIRSAIAGRQKFFERNLAKGVFKDVKQIAAKYPGMRVN